MLLHEIVKTTPIGIEKKPCTNIVLRGERYYFLICQHQMIGFCIGLIMTWKMFFLMQWEYGRCNSMEKILCSFDKFSCWSKWCMTCCFNIDSCSMQAWRSMWYTFIIFVNSFVMYHLFTMSSLLPFYRQWQIKGSYREMCRCEYCKHWWNDLSNECGSFF